MVENFRSLHTRLEEIEYLMKEDGLNNLGKTYPPFQHDPDLRPPKPNAQSPRDPLRVKPAQRIQRPSHVPGPKQRRRQTDPKTLL